MTTLEILRESRDLLDKSYVKWISDDGHGGHCALGAIGAVLDRAHYQTHLTFFNLLDTTATILHPELLGETRERLDGCGIDDFNVSPTVFLNNHVGKEAALAVFDAAILDEELKEATAVEKELVLSRE